MKTDIDIAREANLKDIRIIASKIGIEDEKIELYGNYKGKINIDKIKENNKEYEQKKDGKLILVTSVNPTPAGEGKTTTTVGLGDGLSKIGEKVIIALREPALGPVFGLKGGAAGGGYSQIVPMEDINLHFTGDLNAVAAANNLLVAMLDNHIFFGNELNIDSKQIKVKRVLDVNDRQLRMLESGIKGKYNGVPREESFEIVVASEVMAILCLAEDIFDLKKKLGDIIVAYNRKGEPVTAKDLKANGAMTVLLKEAIKPNLVQTLENTPSIIHGGPFANIAHGCNSVIATKFALKNADYVVTEAGFGADLGAEKFIDIKCRKAGIKPDAVVIVSTIKALKTHGSIKEGLDNLEKHIENIRWTYKLPCIVALNKFVGDTEEEIENVRKLCELKSVEFELSEGWEKGGEGTTKLAKKVVELIEKTKDDVEVKENIPYENIYNINESIENKITKIVTKIYGGKGIELSKKAKEEIIKLEKLNLDKYPICIAKTPYSLSDDMKLLGRPKDFIVKIKDIKISKGAGFIVAYAGNIMTMPGLPKVPAAENIDIDEKGNIIGLF